MKIIAGNWKLQKGPKAIQEFSQQFLELLTQKGSKCRFVVFPQALGVASALQVFANTAVGVGGQNIYSEAAGAFTGENSAEVLKEMGAGYVLVGHSERRQLFGETDEQVAAKVNLAQKIGLTPVLCVGETLTERQGGLTQSVLKKQIERGLAKAEMAQPLWIAYEPVWAIGTGQVASPEQAAEAHAMIRGFINQAPVPLLYGGSVKPDNAGTLGKQPNIDGFLVGGASLTAESFFAIGHAAS